jgi:glycosyltransferase involved in cell wall biosynthesis
MKLSIIIISKNEEKVIKKCILAAIKACRNIYTEEQYEIIIIDSNSTDDTIHIAEQVCLESNTRNWRLIQFKSDNYTAALGRQIGLENSIGKFVLFLDADMCIFTSFVNFADDFFKYSPDDVVGLVGERMDVYYKEEKIEKISLINRKCNKKGETLFPGGCGYYSRYDLNNIRFNVFQKTREEEAFAKQLLASGKKIKYVNEKMYLHFNYKFSKRNINDRIRLVKQSSKDYVNAIRAHSNKFGFIKTITNYFEFLAQYILFPLLMIASLIIYINNLFALSLVLCSVLIFIMKQKLQVFTILFLPMFLFSNSYLENNYTIVRDVMNRKK